MNNRNPTTLNALLVSDDMTPRPCGSQAVIVEIQTNDGTLLLPRLTRVMLSAIQHATSRDVSFGVNGMLAYDLEDDQLVVFSQGRWKTVLTQDLELPRLLRTFPDQTNEELPETYSIVANGAARDPETVPPVTENTPDQTGSLMTPFTNESATSGSRYAVAQPVTESVIDSGIIAPLPVETPLPSGTQHPKSYAQNAALESLLIQKKVLEQELSTLQSEMSQIKALETKELSALGAQSQTITDKISQINNSISTLQTTGG